mgnify:FL=1
MADGDNRKKGTGLQADLSEHLSGFLASLRVDEEVAEEHFRSCGGDCAVDCLVAGLDIDGFLYDCARSANHHSLRVGLGDTVALRSGCHNDELEVGGLCRRIRQLEGETVCGKCELRFARSLYSDKGRRSTECGSTAFHDPVVQPRIEVRPGNLGRSSEHALSFLGACEGIPGEDLCVGERPLVLAELLENGFNCALGTGLESAAVATVTDVLATAHLGCGHSFGGA